MQVQFLLGEKKKRLGTDRQKSSGKIKRRAILLPIQDSEKTAQKLMRKYHELSHKVTVPMMLHLVTRNHLYFQSNSGLGEAGEWPVHWCHHLAADPVAITWVASVILDNPDNFS